MESSQVNRRTSPSVSDLEGGGGGEEGGEKGDEEEEGGGGGHIRICCSSCSMRPPRMATSWQDLMGM